MDDNSSMVEFTGIGELAETTTHLLALNLHAAGRNGDSGGSRQALADPVERLILQQARDYLNKVREGFVLSVHTTQIGRGEIRFLLDRVLMDWAALSRDLGLDETDADAPIWDEPGNGEEEQALEKVRFQLLAFGMAVVALGYLPKLPAKQVTFPHSYGNPPTYSDIPVPSTAGEMLWRIEELQETVWQMMGGNLSNLVQQRYGPVRRTYGFFEASAWLARKEAERFGMKRRRVSFT